MNPLVPMTLAEAEALTFFLAERAELWNRTALDFGVASPLDLPRSIVDAHRVAVRRRTKSKRSR